MEGIVYSVWKRHERSLKLAKLCSYYVDMEKYGLQNEQLEPCKANKKIHPGAKK